MGLAIDHRLALVMYVLLLLGATVPVAMAWLLLLPPEREPFALGERPSGPDRDVFAVFLLVNITLSLLLRIPGIDPETLAAGLAKWISPEWASHAVKFGLIWFAFIGGLAAAYSLIRKNPLRWPLVFGGAFTLLLSLVASPLARAIRGPE